MTIIEQGASAGLRTLQIRSDAMPLVQGRAALEPVRLTGREGVNSLFEYELILKTTYESGSGAVEPADWDLDGFIGREITCCIELDGAGEFIAGAVGAGVHRVGAGVREINALITDATLLGEEGRHVRYRLTLRPWLHLATLRTDCKIFQNRTALQILDDVLGAYGFPVEKRLFGLEGAEPGFYPQRDYQTQFNESDFAFFERLCQEWGISYHFEHGEGRHRLVLCDAVAAYGPNGSEAYRRVEFHPPGWKIDAEYLHSFAPEHHLTSGRYTSRDYDYARPRADLTQGRADPRRTGQADGEVYAWHDGRAGSHYAQPGAGSAEPNDPHVEGRHLALLRMQALRTHGMRARASGNLRGMVPGCTFQLSEHPQQRANTDYLVLDTSFTIEDVGQESQGAPSVHASGRRPQHWRISVDLIAHPVSEPLRPAMTRSKPHTHGPQTALVVGPEGQNLWTDYLGRIKVQFPWDRIGDRNQHSTCWIRASSPWAGNQLGGIHIPRIGQEVIVDFIGGDPDLPICTGRVHNQLNLPPWTLPSQSALSGFRSRELAPEGGNSAAGRSNHLILDDTEAKIQAQLKSDHQHSQLSLGHITRIEDNAGRTDARGEGFELRTDGHGAVRARDGMVLTTHGRERARAHVKDIDETVHDLTRSRDQHETLASLAEHHNAQTAGEDQTAVSEALRAQNAEIGGLGSADRQAGHFPELAAPHMLLSSAAGITANATGTMDLNAGMHVAITSGGHTSISSAKSFLASALESVRLFAHQAGASSRARARCSCRRRTTASRSSPSAWWRSSARPTGSGSRLRRASRSKCRAPRSRSGRMASRSTRRASTMRGLRTTRPSDPRRWLRCCRSCPTASAFPACSRRRAAAARSHVFERAARMEQFALMDGAMAYHVISGSKIFADPKTPWIAALSPHDDLRLAGPLLVAYTRVGKDAPGYSVFVQATNAFAHGLHVSFTQTELSLEALATHLRRFTHFRDSAGDSYALRIADGRVLTYLPEVLSDEQWNTITAPMASWTIRSRVGTDHRANLSERRVSLRGDTTPLHLSDKQIEQLIDACDPDALLAHVGFPPTLADQKNTQVRYETACDCIREWRASGSTDRAVLASFLRTIFEKTGTGVRRDPERMRSLLRQARARVESAVS